ncbi:MAG: hypothetical protein PHT69_17095 [Bacteroidales bacterium]|nr:hypothetical protein [Bacteroidales bacterium]
MDKKFFTNRFFFIAALIAVAVLFRLFTFVPNFTPIAAIALFGGAFMERKSFAFLLPFSALLISDLFLGFHNYMPAVYLSFALVVGLGILMRNNVKVYTVLGGAVAAAILFYLITNFAVWAGTPYYTKDLTGLLQCYTLAIPFFFNSLLGDIFYSSVLFGAFYFAQVRFPSAVRV